MSRSMHGRMGLLCRHVNKRLKRHFEQEFPSYMQCTEIIENRKYQHSTPLRNITIDLKFFFPGVQDDRGYPITRMTYRIYVSEDGRGKGDLKRRGKRDIDGREVTKVAGSELVEEIIDKIVDVVQEVPEWKVSRRF